VFTLRTLCPPRGRLSTNASPPLSDLVPNSETSPISSRPYYIVRECHRCLPASANTDGSGLPHNRNGRGTTELARSPSQPPRERPAWQRATFRAFRNCGGSCGELLAACQANRRTRCKKAAKKTLSLSVFLDTRVFAEIRHVPRLKGTRDLNCNQDFCFDARCPCRME